MIFLYDNTKISDCIEEIAGLLVAGENASQIWLNICKIHAKWE
jgi:hypothetical protein